MKTVPNLHDLSFISAKSERFLIECGSNHQPREKSSKQEKCLVQMLRCVLVRNFPQQLSSPALRPCPPRANTVIFTTLYPTIFQDEICSYLPQLPITKTHCSSDSGRSPFTIRLSHDPKVPYLPNPPAILHSVCMSKALVNSYPWLQGDQEQFSRLQCLPALDANRAQARTTMCCFAHILLHMKRIAASPAEYIHIAIYHFAAEGDAPPSLRGTEFLTGAK